VRFLRGYPTDLRPGKILRQST